MSDVSADYQELKTEEEIKAAFEAHGNAWLDPKIPFLQYEEVVRPELEKWRSGKLVAPFNTLVTCLRWIGVSGHWSMLDLGAASGYYREVLRIAGIDCRYVACDWSDAFKELALRLWPDMEFHVSGAGRLPFLDGEFDIVMSGAMIMHMHDFEAAIREARRVSSKYVILHRTPVFFETAKLTTCYLKKGYGIPMPEWHFNKIDFEKLLAFIGLDIEQRFIVFKDDASQFGHITYLCRKYETMHWPHFGTEEIQGI